MGLFVLLDDLEGEELDVMLDRLVSPFPANESLGIKDGVLRVGGELVLGRVTNESLPVGGECYIGGRDPVALVVSNDLNSAIFEHAHTEKSNPTLEMTICNTIQ